MTVHVHRLNRAIDGRVATESDEEDEENRQRLSPHLQQHNTTNTNNTRLNT